MKLIELSKEDFGKFEARHPLGNLMQWAERVELREWMGWQAYLLGSKAEVELDTKAGLKAKANAELDAKAAPKSKGGALETACLLLIRERRAMIQLGPMLDFENAKILKDWLEAIKDFCADKNVIELEIYPNVLMNLRDKHGEILQSNNVDGIRDIFTKSGFEYYGETTEMGTKSQRWMAVKNISGMKNMDDVWASYKCTVRNQLRKMAPDVEVVDVRDKKEIAKLVPMFDESNKRNKVISRKLEYFEKIYEIFGDKVIFQAAKLKKTGQVIGAHMFFVSKDDDEAVSFTAGISEEFKSYHGMTFLNDAFFKKCLELGISRCNLYGVAGDFENKNPLLSFKSHFGIQVEEYLGGFRYVFDKKALAHEERKAKMMGGLRRIKYAGKRLLKK